jgi:ATP-dependent Clp protease ATP-binding subunit ClpB
VVQKLTEGYNPYYGFRSIQHEVEKKVVNQLADAHEKDLITNGSTVEIGLDSTGEITLKFQKPSKK